MSIPVVAIVGRPNVGKSSLFNSLVGRRTSIVEPTPGVTRDRVSSICDFDEKLFFELVDTGGFGIVDRDDLTDHVVRQIRFAIERATLILFLVDARDGLTPLDRATAEWLRPHHDRVRLIANKVDEPHMADAIGEFARLGFGEPLAASAVTGLGRSTLRDLLTLSLASLESDAPDDPVMKLAIVGKRNAGKSSFINAIAGEERVIVSEVPGTTRDSIDVRLSRDGRTFVAIDTAGVRKKSRLADDIEFFAQTRVRESIHRADVALFLLDSTVPAGQVDKNLAQILADEHKPFIFVVNKWDLAKGKAGTEEYGEYLTKIFPQVAFAPVAFTSAKSGRNIQSAIDVAMSLFKQSRTRVGTGQLNAAMQHALQEKGPSSKRGRTPPKFYYATQVSVQPPTIVVFVNRPESVTQDYERFLLKRFREHLPFAEVPLRLVFRPRRSADAEGKPKRAVSDPGASRKESRTRRGAAASPRRRTRGKSSVAGAGR